MVFAAAVGLLCWPAVAQEVFFDFEGYSTGAINGQDGWFEVVNEGGAAIVIDTDNGPSDPNGSQCLEMNDLGGDRIEIDRWFDDVVAAGGRLVTFRYDYRKYNAESYYAVDRLNNTWQGHWWDCWSQWNAAADIEGNTWGWDGRAWPECDDAWHTVEWTILCGDEAADQIGVLLKLTFDGVEDADWAYPYLGPGYSDAVETVVLRLDEAYWNVQNNDQIHIDNILIRGEAPPSAIPDADAGPDKVLDITWSDLVELDASASSDDGEIVRYRWSIGGLAVLYDGPDAAPQVYMDDGTYTLQLDVWDDDGLRNADLAVYTITKPDILDEVAGPWGIRNADIYGTGASDQIVIDTSSGEFEVVNQVLVPGPWWGTPTEGDNLVFDQFGNFYFLSWNELLESYDKDLNRRWRASEGGQEKVLGGDIGHHTIIAGVRSIYVVGGDRGDPNIPDEPKIYAFRKSNGELLWETYLDGEDWSGQPGRPKVTLYNDKLYVVGETGGPATDYVNIYQVDASTGDLDWSSTCLVELQYMMDNNVGGTAFIPDAFGTGLHGLVWNQMSDFSDYAGGDDYADIAAVMIDPSTGATAVWDITAPDPELPDGPGLDRSHPIYSPTTGLVYTPSQFDLWSASFYAWDVNLVDGLYGSYSDADGGEHGYRDNFVLEFDGLTVHAPSAFDSIYSYTDNLDGTYSVEYRDYGGYLEHGWGFSTQGCLLKNQEGHSIFITASDQYYGDPNELVASKIVAVDLSEPADPNGNEVVAEWVAGEYDPNLPGDPPWRWTWNTPYAGPTPGPDGSIYFFQNDWDWWYEYDRITRLQFKVACPGDINGDGKTYQEDLGVLLAAWDSYPGDANWNPDADLNGDGHIHQEDLGIVLGDWECGM
jgi:hypothetical protein